MEPRICLYFQVHQPYRLRDLRITDIGNTGVSYFDDTINAAVFRKVAEKCYLPANAHILELLQQYPDFRVAYSLSGVFLDQCTEYGPDVLASFRALAATGKVEFLAETYYHSMASVGSMSEYCNQVCRHVQTIEELFGMRPRIFRNTELIFRNDLAHAARLMGFRGMLAEGADRILHGRSPNQPYMPPPMRLPRAAERIIARSRPLEARSDRLHVLLKNYRLSDDVAFRFSDTAWMGYPLDARRFTDWISGSGGFVVNLFMDYETFGEHQWSETGIFDFLRSLPKIWEQRGIRCATPSEVLDAWEKQTDTATDIFDAPEYVSWADTERDLSAWYDNPIQQAAMKTLYALEPLVLAANDPTLLETWRRLQTSDHFYYMCTKFWSDGDVHKYFSPYDSPYEAYRRFSNALHDLRIRLDATVQDGTQSGRSVATAAARTVTARRNH